jgi:hypothetical protein
MIIQKKNPRNSESRRKIAKEEEKGTRKQILDRAILGDHSSKQRMDY